MISRLLRAESGQFVITAAGITQYATGAAAEILTNPPALAEVLRRAPRGWEKRNLQMLFHIRVIDRVAGPPALIALHEW